MRSSIKHRCRVCGVRLNSSNWVRSRRKSHDYLCRDCNKLRCAKWHEKHSSQDSAYYIKWNDEHPNYRIQWYKSNPNYNSRYYKSRREEIIKEVKQYRKSPNGKLLKARANAKRHRSLSTDTILGKWFPDSHLHHSTPSVAVYIPKNLHRSIYHDLRRGLNMDKINVAAMEYYERGGRMA